MKFRVEGWQISHNVPSSEVFSFLLILWCMGAVAKICDQRLLSSHCIHGENAGTLGMVPLIINPIYTLYSGYLLGISPLLKGSLGG